MSHQPVLGPISANGPVAPWPDGDHLAGRKLMPRPRPLTVSLPRLDNWCANSAQFVLDSRGRGLQRFTHQGPINFSKNES